MAADWEEFRAGSEDGGRRIDRILRILLPTEPLSTIYRAMRKGDIRLNGRKSDPSSRVSEGDLIGISSRSGLSVRRLPASSGAFAPPPGGLEVILENEDLLVISKPKGMLSHGPGSAEESVRAGYGARSDSLAFTPGPLHRLDRNTSGLLCFSRSLLGAQEGTRAFREGLTLKLYVALLSGTVEGPERWDDVLERDGEMKRSFVSDGEGKAASSRCVPIALADGATLAAIILETGRTHQIRVQASARGHALLGDSKYGGRPLEGGYLLHSWALSFGPGLPASFPDRVTAPLPASWRGQLERIFGPGIVEKASSALLEILGSLLH